MCLILIHSNLFHFILNRQVKGCPLKVTVSSTCDPSKVVCSGEGLKWGIIRKDIKSFIDTRKSGPVKILSIFLNYNFKCCYNALVFLFVKGDLTSFCVGLTKAGTCDLFVHQDGTYTLNVKPQEHGHHSLTVKFAGKS